MVGNTSATEHGVATQSTLCREDTLDNNGID